MLIFGGVPTFTKNFSAEFRLYHQNWTWHVQGPRVWLISFWIKNVLEIGVQNSSRIFFHEECLQWDVVSEEKRMGTELDAFPDVDDSLSGVAMWRCASHIPMCHRKAKGQGPATCNLWCEKTITQFDFAKRIFIQQFELPLNRTNRWSAKL